MYIADLRIVNYRNFSEFNVSLNNGLSIIIGENNVGKSNFLEALSLIFNSNYSLRKRTLEQEDFWNGLKIQNAWPEILIEATLKGIDSENELATTSKWLTRNPGEAKITYKYRPKANISILPPKVETPIGKIRLPLNEYEWVIYGGECETLDTFDYNMLSKFNIEYVGALRDATAELRKSSGPLHRIMKNFNLDEFELQEISDKLDELNGQIIKGKEIQKVQRGINNHLRNITGVTSQQVKIKMSDNDYDSLLKELKILIGSQEDNIHSVDMNGLGYNNLLYTGLLLTQYTAIKEKRLQNHDYVFPILIVEEPEAHLHSNLQKYLAKYFFDQKVVGQVIMTTHSSHVSSHAELDSLVMFYKKNDKNLSKRIGTIFNIKEKENREYKRYLERWLDATKSDIFFGQKILLVEGIAERLLIPKFFSMIYKEQVNDEDSSQYKGKSLEGEGISIISVDGVAFRPFLQLFGPTGLDMKCAVLTDSDPESVPILDGEGKEIKGRDGKVVKENVYPTKGGEFESCARTAGLIRDYDSSSNIYISSNLKTFEYDLMMENNIQFFQELIQKYDIGTKGDRERLLGLDGHEFAKEAYKVISKEKGEFSQYILDELNEGKELNIPKYITQVFEFLMKVEGT
ncbi:ATP-dependent nuclease [Lysinibacillus pakistanensis]|uniref:AAA family ATPase n=1 Tax=Lysinibacillus pakistanensis TaxID=759811 RepID=A0AAX3WSK5_9BACI|nr:AAA family ATPase [Lysinibacillus pakistanensis]MDM5230204.1 AAA family ATPase [Lysinibacillus pakistanensis]WHY45794.1 AAA family ATPase [Lysinibacillus pakistanensis]WHY50806.1 AAA family ATPase [Lysinibacillus pakistanensis]